MTTATEAKHTPAPWTVSGTSIYAGTTCIAACYGDRTHVSPEANARLIAELPALLEAARFALDVLNDLPATGTDANDRDNAISTLEFAIRKAASN
jgi:hypothetical protein